MTSYQDSNVDLLRLADAECKRALYDHTSLNESISDRMDGLYLGL